MRTMKKMTGKSEEELRDEMRTELEALEREVSALKELLKTKPTPKAKGGKKATEGEEKPKATEGEEKPKAKRASPKKKTAVTAVVEAEPESEALNTEAPAMTEEPTTTTPAVAEEEKPKAKKAAPKKKAVAVAAAEGTTGEVSEVEEKPKAKKAAPKKNTEATEGQEKPKAKKAAPKKVAVAVAVATASEAVKDEAELTLELEREMPTEEEEVEVEEMEYDGVMYLRSVKGIVYDMETSEEIGRWNAKTKRIEVE